jgi:hypothetical protein
MPEVNNHSISPVKPGILLTPGTTRGKRKDVTFCAEVVDNEGKTTNKAAVSHAIPGKFPSPSPWTSKATTAGEEKKKTKTKLTAALYDAQATGTPPKDKTKLRAEGDADITVDIMEPRSESGRYWKEQYMLYSRKSEEETKKLIAKQRLAKEYARKKDDEAVEARQQLDMEKRRRHKRERTLEKEIKELRELLRQALGENGKASTEVALLRQEADNAKSRAKKNLEPVKETTATAPSVPDSIWEDAADINEEHARVIPFLDASVIQSRGSQVQSTRVQRPERKLSRKRGSVSRMNSLPTPKSPEVHLQSPDRIPTPTPERRSGSRGPRRTLGERNPNIGTSSPAPRFHSPSDFHEKPKRKQETKPKREDSVLDNYKPFNPAEFLDSFDAGADYSVIEDPRPLQSQPASTVATLDLNTPPVSMAAKHYRSDTQAILSADRESILPGDRGAAAKARVAERMAQRRRAKESARAV